MEENFLLDLVSALDQKRSQKQLDSDIKTLEKTINMLHLTATLAQGSSKKEINAYIKSLQSQLNHVKLTAKIDSKNIKSEIDSALNKVSFKDIDILNIDENKTRLKMQKVISDAKAYVEKNPISVGVNIESKKNKLGNDLTSYLNRNTKISESSILLQEADKVRNLIGAINDKKSLREATDAFQLYKSEVSATGFATKSTTDKIKNMFGHITKLGSVFSVTSMAFTNFTRSLGTLKDIDDILTEISKTSNLTAQELEKLGDISFKSASKYGKTASDYLLGIQEMSRSGFYGEKGSAMAEQSLLAQAAGDMSADVANKYILATNAAYKYNGEAEKLNAVLDGQNSITNRNSVSLSDMAVAMSEAGTVASSYRVSIEDLSAMIGTMESVTKLGGSEIGNGIKAILINLQNVTSSKITDTLDAANASMTEFVNGTEKLRDPISILRDLADTFNQLDEDDALRAEILTNIGGKHQASKLAALLQNMELFDKMLVDYSEGAGSAMEEAMKSANNWSGKLNQLQNSWDSLVNSITNKEAVLGGISFFDKLIQGAESFVDTFGTLPTVLTTFTTAMTALNKDFGITQIINPETKKFDIEGNLGVVDFTAIKNQKKHFEEAGTAIAKWNDILQTGKADIETFGESIAKNNAQFKAYLQTTSKDAPASLNGYKTYLQQTGQATEDLRLQTILLNTALTFIGSIAVQAVITGIVQAFDKFNETVVESKEKVDDINSKISELKTQIEELNNLEYKSEFDNQKISQLERELELQQKILEVEQKRLYQNQIGTKFSDYFDDDSLVSKRETQLDRRNKEGYTYLSLKFKTDKSSIDEIEEEIESLQYKLDNGLLNGHENAAEGKMNQLIEKRNNLLKEQQTIEDQLVINAGEYLENYRVAKEAVESGLLTGSDLEKAESMVEYWDSLYKDSLGIVTNIQKMNGRYDNTNDLLEEKFANISHDDLASLSDDDKRIALSFDPDNIIGFEELQQKIEETKGDIEGLNATEVSPTLSLSETIDQLNEQIRPVFDSLKSAWQDIFTDDGFALDSIDIIATCDSIKAELDEMSELGLEVDYSAYEHFIEVLSNSESEAEDVKDSFNQLAASITQAGVSGAEDLETLKAALEDLGVVNEELVAFDALVSNIEALKESGLDLASATNEEITAFANEMVSAENVAQAIAMLTFQKELCGLQDMNTSGEVANLLTLAENAGYTGEVIEHLTELEQIYQQVASGTLTPGQLDAKLARAAELETAIKESASNIKYEPQVDYSGATKSASKAGKEAGDAYLDAFKEEYDHLKDQLDRGEISEAQYLSRLRALYTKYFKDRKEYLDEFKKYESEYLSGMLDLHNKALSGISTLLNRKVSAANDAKDASISALEEEKEKAQDAYQSQIDAIEKEKDAIDDLIKEKNKKIDAINDEIDAIERASETRKKNINLQQQEYNLQKMLNQKTSLVYEGGQFKYKTDTTGIRDAREKVTEAKEALQIDSLKNEISLIQKEIDLLEEKKDALSEEQERIQKLMDESNKYYDNLIKQQEQYWDSLIKGMEQQKSRWEELAEVKEIAEAFSYIQQVFGDLGYTVEDVLNGSDAAFEDFKSQYISLISDMNKNSSFAEGLSYATGVAEENLDSFLDKTKETAEGLGELGEKGSEMDSVAQGMDRISDSATTASTNTEGLSDNLTTINNALSDMPEAENINNIATAFTNLGEAIQSVANALGIGEDGAISTLVTALEEISTLSLDGAGGGEGEESSGGGVITQFKNLKTAIEDATNAISGGGESGGDGDASGSSSPSMSASSDGEGGGLLGAIEEIKSVTDEALGGGGGEGEESEGEGDGAIPQFQELKTAVDDVTAAIGIEGSEGGEGSGEGSENTLIGALRAQYETASEVLPETKALFEELLEVIMSCVSALNSMVGVMESMSTIGGFGGISVSPHAKGTVGNAFANGTKYKGLPNDEKNALVSEYGQPEMTVLPNGKTILTDKPTLMDLPKDTVIFNERQTKKIMENKVDASGNAFAGGTADEYWIGADGHKYRDIRPGDRAWELQEALKPFLAKMQEGEEFLSNAYFEHTKQMEKWTREITNNTAINNVTNNNAHQPVTIHQNITLSCPNLTNNSGIEYVQKQFGHLSQRAMQETLHDY